MCQDKVRFVLERNFTFFDDAALAKNTLYFTSTAAPDGKEILRSFQKQLGKLDTVVFVERVPSARARLHLSSKTSDEKLFQASSMAPSAMSTSPSSAEQFDDILVSVKSTACFRIMMKLDRWWLRQVGRLGYYLCPKMVSDLVYDQIAKRRTLWGTSEKCAVLNSTRSRDTKGSGAWIDGLKERRWIRIVERPGLGKGKASTSK